MDNKNLSTDGMVQTHQYQSTVNNTTVHTEYFVDENDDAEPIVISKSYAENISQNMPVVKVSGRRGNNMEKSYGKITPFQDPHQSDGDKIPVNMVVAKEKIVDRNGRVKKFIDDFDGDSFGEFVLDVYPAAKKNPYIRERLANLHGDQRNKFWSENCFMVMPPRIGYSAALGLSRRPDLQHKKFKEPAGFKPNHIYFDESYCPENRYIFTCRWDDKCFWENHTVAEFIIFGAYVDVIYGWREYLHRQKESYSVRVNRIQEFVFSTSDIQDIRDLTVMIENLLKYPYTDVSLYDSMDITHYKMCKFIYHIPRYSRGGKW